MKHLDTWTGGSNPLMQFTYRLSLDDGGEYHLDVKVKGDPDERYAPATKGSGHRVALALAEILREEDEVRQKVRKIRG